MTITDIGVLLHEKLSRPGVFISFVRKHTEEGGILLALSFERVERLDDVSPTLAVYNDQLAERLIRQELDKVFPTEEIPKVIEAIRTLSAVFGMPMVSPAVAEAE